MCLSLPKNEANPLDKFLCKPYNNRAVRYKVVRYSEPGAFGSGVKTVHAPVQQTYIYDLTDWNITVPPGRYAAEREHPVNFGFHVFVSKKDALYYLHEWHDKTDEHYYLAKLEVRDFRGGGEFSFGKFNRANEVIRLDLRCEVWNEIKFLDIINKQGTSVFRKLKRAIKQDA